MHRRIKILFLAPSMRIGGAERFIVTLSKHISRDKFAPEIALVNGVGPLIEELPRDVFVGDMNAKRVRYAILKILKIVRQKEPEVVFSTVGHLNAAVAVCRPLLSSKIKFVIRETNLPSINGKQSMLGRPLACVYAGLSRTVEKIVCQSNDMRDDLVRFWGVKKSCIVVINNGVDILGIRKRAEGKERVFRGGRPELLSVGKLKYQKGFDLLLRALSLIKNTRLHLTILGDGPEKNKLKRLCCELGLAAKVTFQGLVSNPYPYFDQADLFVLSSRYEGFPNVILEANACGTPVVAFSCPGGINEIIEQGVNGCTVKCGDIEEMAKGIKDALGKQFNRESARNVVEEKFEVGKMIGMYEQLFLNILKKKD